MATRNRTRSESSTRLTEYSGTGKELCPTDPNISNIPTDPNTLPDCLRYGIYLGDEPQDSTTPTANSFRKSSSKSSGEVDQRELIVSASVIAADKTMLERLLKL